MTELGINSMIEDCMSDIESLGRPEIDDDTLKNQNSEQLLRELAVAYKKRRRSWYLMKKPTLELEEAEQLMHEIKIWDKRVKLVADALIEKISKEGRESDKYKRYLEYLKEFNYNELWTEADGKDAKDPLQSILDKLRPSSMTEAGYFESTGNYGEDVVKQAPKEETAEENTKIETSVQPTVETDPGQHRNRVVQRETPPAPVHHLDSSLHPKNSFGGVAGNQPGNLETPSNHQEVGNPSAFFVRRDGCCNPQNEFSSGSLIKDTTANRSFQANTILIASGISIALLPLISWVLWSVFNRSTSLKEHSRRHTRDWNLTMESCTT